MRQIDDPTANKRPAIVHADHNAPIIGEIGHTQLSAEWQMPMGTSHRPLIEPLATRGAASMKIPPIPRRRTSRMIRTGRCGSMRLHPMMRLLRTATSHQCTTGSENNHKSMSEAHSASLLLHCAFCNLILPCTLRAAIPDTSAALRPPRASLQSQTPLEDPCATDSQNARRRAARPFWPRSPSETPDPSAP